MLATLTNVGDFVKFTQQEPYHYVTKLLNWVEDLAGLGTVKKEFRWGVTNLVRASWIDLTVENLSKIILNPENDLYLDFRYTLVGGGPIIINDVYLEYDQSAEAADRFLGYRPPLLVSEKGNISNLTKIENFTFRPYEVNPAIVLYKELSYAINKLFGHDVQYARAVPMSIGRDFTLHEWTLYDVDDPCTVKVLVPENEFPDSKIEFNAMGLDFEMPFEVHIVKAYFEEVFGIGTAPQKRDILYFPLANRIYEVESSYLWKDIMQREVYWKVALKKYAPKSNRYEPQDLREQLDSISWDSEERFGEEVRNDELKITKPDQYDPKLGSRYYDPVRLEVNDSLVISEDVFRNYNLSLSESQYDLRSIFATTNNPIAVKYRENAIFPADTNEGRSLVGWIKETKPRLTLPKDAIRGQLQKGVVTSTTTAINFVITMKRSYQLGDLVKITRFNGLSLYGSFLSTTPIAGGFALSIEVDNEIITFLDSYYPGWASSSVSSGYHLEPAYETFLMDGYDNSTQSGWKLSIYASRYFVFKSTSEKLTFILPNNLIEGSWYGFFLNINNFYQQISLDVWIRKWTEGDSNPPKTTDLENIYSRSYISQPVNRTANEGDYNYRLPASNLTYTNIRLFNQTESDLIKQMTILNQTIVQDAQFAIIIDNAIPRLRLPFIGKTK
jgi:hypothetical protein